MEGAGAQRLQNILMIVPQNQHNMIQFGFQGGVQHILEQIFSLQFQNLFGTS
jgi:hypothetical protein